LCDDRMNRPPLRIGLTGGIASGKSLVAAMLRDLGAGIVDADVVAREVLAPGGPAYADVVAAFGPGIVLAGGGIDRKALAALIFGDPAARQRLNAFTHPHIRRRMDEETARLATSDRYEIIALDIPLLFETRGAGDLDGVMVVYTDDAIRLKRLMARDGVTEDEARRRMAVQMPLAEKAARADWLIDNSGTPEDTRRQVERAWLALRDRWRNG
jgi:dephospho-CoA kinase